MNQAISLPYTICFCLQNEQVLMLYRYKEPNQYLWSGIGGKIEPGETPTKAMKRELKEETGLDIRYATAFSYAGVVTWDNPNQAAKGMHAFLIQFPSDLPVLQKQETREGILEWKQIAWVCDTNNACVPSTVHHFLPKMLHATKPMRYHCEYRNNKISACTISQLIY